jgi:hypothetical protein
MYHGVKTYSGVEVRFHAYLPRQWTEEGTEPHVQAALNRWKERLAHWTRHWMISVVSLDAISCLYRESNYCVSVIRIMLKLNT